MKSRLRNFFVALTCLAALPLAAACGDDEGSPSDSCAKIVDGYAKWWDRCDRMTYDEAKSTFEDQFGCGKVKHSHQGQVDACLEDLSNANCSSVGVALSSCQDALTK